jgi:hypothetical protein
MLFYNLGQKMNQSFTSRERTHLKAEQRSKKAEEKGVSVLGQTRLFVEQITLLS